MRLRNALTLVELVVVLMVLAALAGLMMPLFAGTIQNANEVTTRQTLVEIRDAIAEYWQDTKYITLDGVTSVATEADRFSIDWLFANPVTGDSTFTFSANTCVGWRGPYLLGTTGDIVALGSPQLIDAWNNPVHVQDVDPSAMLRDVRVVSGGPDGSISIPGSTATTALTTTDVGDDLYVALTLR